jgi:hypothetical protein
MQKAVNAQAETARLTDPSRPPQCSFHHIRVHIASI